MRWRAWEELERIIATRLWASLARTGVPGTYGRPRQVPAILPNKLSCCWVVRENTAVRSRTLGAAAGLLVVASPESG